MNLENWQTTVALVRLAQLERRTDYAALMVASLAAKRDRRPLTVHGDLEDAVRKVLAPDWANTP